MTDDSAPASTELLGNRASAAAGVKRPASLRAMLSELEEINNRIDRDPPAALAEAIAWAERVLDASQGPFEPGYEIRIRLYASTVVINAAMACSSEPDLEIGAQWASAAIEAPGFVETDRLSARYNLANARSEIVKLRVAQRHASNPQSGWAVASRDVRWENRELLATARAGYRAYATQFPNHEQQSTGWCNLGNEFDTSGRWVEAYDAYVAALAADPTNGNAAASAARMIRRIAEAGWGYGSHLHGLHDSYLAQAKNLRDRTVEIAGEYAAELVDAMTPFGCESPTHHPAQSSDPYQVWVVHHRLALAPALEGVGANENHWDSAMIRGVATTAASAEVPAIFRMLNLIKAEYLTARRLAYQAECMLDEAPYEQHPTDPGRYIDTLDYSLYGEPTAMLFLAQRAALDTLDKVAVAVNEHLQLGDNPKRINFRDFWTTKKHNQIRPELLVHNTIAFLALAELANDLDKDGLYAQVQSLRNAATHRFPLAHLGWREVAATEALVPVTVDQTIAATRHALSIARSAFMYVVATLDAIESQKLGASPLSLPLHDQYKAESVKA